MINAPLVALMFNEGSGSTTANTGTLGGSATVIGSWATSQPVSVFSPHLRLATPPRGSNMTGIPVVDGSTRDTSVNSTATNSWALVALVGTGNSVNMFRLTAASAVQVSTGLPISTVLSIT